MLNGMGDVIGAVDLFFGTPETGHGSSIAAGSIDIDAIAVVLDDAREPAHLAFDPHENLLSTDVLAFACMLAIRPERAPVSRGPVQVGTDRSGLGVHSGRCSDTPLGAVSESTV